MRSPRRTTCSPPWSTPTSSTATSSTSTRTRSPGGRSLDVNDRTLRNVVTGLGGRLDGTPTQTGFDITAASEVMAALSLTTSMRDLRERLGRIVVGYDRSGKPVTAEEIQARRRHGGHHARGHQAEPDADPGEHPGAGARRAVRQHRHRRLVGGRRPHRPAHQRLRGHRGGVRGRHGRRALLQPQVPGLGRGTRRRGARGDRPRRSRSTRERTTSCPASRSPPRCSPRTPTRSLARGGQPDQADREHPDPRSHPRRRDQRLPHRPRLGARRHRRDRP